MVIVAVVVVVNAQVGLHARLWRRERELYHRCSSVGHSLRGIHRPSSSKRGLRGYASPSSLFDPIGTVRTVESDRVSDSERKGGVRTEPRPRSWTKDLLPVCPYVTEPPHVTLAPDAAPLGVPCLPRAALLSVTTFN